MHQGVFDQVGKKLDKQLTIAADTIRRSLKTQADTAAQQVAALEGQVSHLKTTVLDERNREIQYNILQREVDTTRSLYDGLLQRYKEIGIAGGITTNNISIVDRARPPGGLLLCAHMVREVRFRGMKPVIA